MISHISIVVNLAAPILKLLWYFDLYHFIGHSSQPYMENAVELVRIVRQFVTEKSSEVDVFSETVGPNSKGSLLKY